MSRRLSTSRQGRLTLDLNDLRTVRYIKAQPSVRKAWNNTTTNYEKGKQIPAVGMLLVWFEMYSSWLWRTVHAIPFPEFVVSTVYQIDDRTERALDYTVDQAEWWWDSISIRLMWIQEGLEIRRKQLVELINKTMGMMWIQEGLEIRRKQLVELINRTIGIYKEFVMWYLSTIMIIIKWSVAVFRDPITASRETWDQLKEYLQNYGTRGSSNIMKENYQHQHQQSHQQHQQSDQQQQQFVDTDDEVEIRKTDSVAKGGSLRRLFQKSDKGSGNNGDVNGYPSESDDQRPLSPTNAPRPGSRSGSLKRFNRIFSKNKEGDNSSDQESAYGDSPVSSAPGSPEPSQKPFRSSSFFGRKSTATSGNSKHPTGNVIEGSRRTFSMKGLRSRK